MHSKLSVPGNFTGTTHRFHLAQQKTPARDSNPPTLFSSHPPTLITQQKDCQHLNVESVVERLSIVAENVEFIEKKQRQNYVVFFRGNSETLHFRLERQEIEPNFFHGNIKFAFRYICSKLREVI